jgi:hypothetical protein
MALSRLSLHKHIRRLKDPRLNRRKRHLLGDILTIAVCAVLAGAHTWPDSETFGRQRLDWLRRFLELPNGIPSHDTFERVFDRLEPQALQTALLGWLHEISAALGVQHIAIDGKTQRCVLPAAVPRRCVTCTWSVPGPSRPTGPWASWPRTRNPTKSRPFPACWSCWT